MTTFVEAPPGKPDQSDLAHQRVGDPLRVDLVGALRQTLLQLVHDVSQRFLEVCCMCLHCPGPGIFIGRPADSR
jgi:hypothetical protein